MVPLIPFYYVALVVFTVLFANYNPYFTLPEVADKIGGYLDAASSSLFGTEVSVLQKNQQTQSLIPMDFPKIKSLICQNSKVIASIDKVTGWWDKYVLPYILRLEKILEPLFLKLEEAFTPLALFLRPYWVSFKEFIAPYANIARNQVCAAILSLKKFVTPYFEQLSEICVSFISWLKSNYQTYLERYVDNTKETVIVYSREVQLWYSTTVEPFAEEHQAISAIIVSTLSLLILIPIILPHAKKTLRYLTKDAYNLGNGINSMYNADEKSFSELSSEIPSGSSSREGTPVGVSGNASLRAKKA